MKKVKQILAILGIILILGINVVLIFAAGNATEDNTNVFHAAMVTVVLVPVLLWIYLYVFKLIKKSGKDENRQQNEAQSE